MADIEFLCPECSGELVVDERGAGLDVNCPHCKAPIQVPWPEDETATEEDPTQKLPPRQESSTGLHFKKDPNETWIEHAEESSKHVKQTLVGLNPMDEIEAADLHEADAEVEKNQEDDSGASSLHLNRADDSDMQAQDVNVDQPWFKKKDYWFTADGKKYHYCYYNPHAPVMLMACNSEQMPVSADIAPDDCSGLRKRSLCKYCLKGLDLRAEDVLAGA